MKGWEIRQKLKPGYRVKVDWNILRKEDGNSITQQPKYNCLLTGWYEIERIEGKGWECNPENDNICNRCAGPIEFSGIDKYLCLAFPGDVTGNISPFIDYYTYRGERETSTIPYKKKSLYSRKLRVRKR